MNGETFPFSDAILQARAALALPPDQPAAPAPVAAGEWIIDPNDDLPLAVIENTEDGIEVCEIGERTPENMARARLIAAAPDMLAALRECLNPLIRLGDFIGNEHKGENGIPAFDRCAIIRQVRAAIARATGREG